MREGNIGVASKALVVFRKSAIGLEKVDRRLTGGGGGVSRGGVRDVQVGWGAGNPDPDAAGGANLPAESDRICTNGGARVGSDERAVDAVVVHIDVNGATSKGVSSVRNLRRMARRSRPRIRLVSGNFLRQEIGVSD